MPGRYFDDYLKKHIATGFGVNGLMQSSMAEFIYTGDYRRHINKICLMLNKQVNQYRQFLIEHLPNDAKISLPQGGVVLWIQVPNLNAVELEKAALAKQINMRSGACFSTHDFYHDCFRINCGWPLVESQDEISVYQQLMTLCKLISKNTF